MDKVKNLQEKAAALKMLLEKYGQIDSDAEMVLGFMAPLFAQIFSGKVLPPHKHVYRWYFANTDSPLFKYDDLCEAAAQFGHALEDWPIHRT